MSELERKLIEKIRNSQDPDALMNYIEELLLNPLALQEVLKTQSALLQI